ncbi:MAG: methyltransferase domain-containing protein [Patescibacteria group bacterium]
MKLPFQQFESECMQEIAKRGRVLDVGGGSRFQKGMKQYETLFANTRYETMDVSADYSPDIVGDIHAIPLEEASVDAIICRSVLEHVQDPGLAMKEMYRILKPGGVLFLQVPSTYPYHARKGFGAYPDYWRFFGDTLEMVGKPFSSTKLVKHGGWFMAMSFFLPGQAVLRGVLNVTAMMLDKLFATEQKTTTAFYSALYTK